MCFICQSLGLQLYLKTFEAFPGFHDKTVVFALGPVTTMTTIPPNIYVIKGLNDYLTQHLDTLKSNYTVRSTHMSYTTNAEVLMYLKNKLYETNTD
jgi:hypothetical protein